MLKGRGRARESRFTHFKRVTNRNHLARRRRSPQDQTTWLPRLSRRERKVLRTPVNGMLPRQIVPFRKAIPRAVALMSIEFVHAHLIISRCLSAHHFYDGILLWLAFHQLSKNPDAGELIAYCAHPSAKPKTRTSLCLRLEETRQERDDWAFVTGFGTVVNVSLELDLLENGGVTQVETHVSAL